MSLSTVGTGGPGAFPEDGADESMMAMMKDSRWNMKVGSMLGLNRKMDELYSVSFSFF